MWSYVWNKENPRWLWHAIDHTTGEVLAYILGDRKSALGTVWHHAFTRMVGGATNAIRANLRNNALKNA